MLQYNMHVESKGAILRLTTWYMLLTTKGLNDSTKKSSAFMFNTLYSRKHVRAH